MSSNLQDRIKELDEIVKARDVEIDETGSALRTGEQQDKWFQYNGPALLAAYKALIPACEVAQKKADNAIRAERFAREEVTQLRAERNEWKDSAFRTAQELTRYVDKLTALKKHISNITTSEKPNTCKECGGLEGFHFHFCSNE